MEERKQKTNGSCPREDRLEAEVIDGAQTYMEITEGRLAEVQIDEKHLIELLSHTIKDGRGISLIHKYLYAGVMVNGVYQPTTEGTPQGGPLSPLLSNIVLNELDKELERRGHPFVRYADDSLIFCKSKRGAERVCESLTKFIEKKLFRRPVRA